MHPFGGTPICPRCSKAVYAAEQVSIVGLCQLVLTFPTRLLGDGPRQKGPFSSSLWFQRAMPTSSLVQLYHKVRYCSSVTSKSY